MTAVPCREILNASFRQDAQPCSVGFPWCEYSAYQCDIPERGVGKSVQSAPSPCELGAAGSGTPVQEGAGKQGGRDGQTERAQVGIWTEGRAAD